MNYIKKDINYDLWYSNQKKDKDIYHVIDKQFDFGEIWENMFKNSLKEKYDLTIEELEEMLKNHYPEKLI